MPIKIELDGFDELIKQIEKAGGNAQNAAYNAAQQSCHVVLSEIDNEMSSANVSPRLISSSSQGYSIEQSPGYISASVGFKKGAYDPKNPSDGYKVVFLNYGTPHRKKHGQVKARGFIQKAKKKSRAKVKKIQEDTLKEILKGL